MSKTFKKEVLHKREKKNAPYKRENENYLKNYEEIEYNYLEEEN